MTANRDPNLNRDPNRRRPSDYVRREDGSWSFVPNLLGLALLLGLGYLVLGGDWDNRTNTPNATGTRTTGPTTTPPATTPSPTTPKQ